MKLHAIVFGVVLSLVGAGAALAQTGTVLGTVTLGRGVMADGKPLAAGTYQVRLASGDLKAAAGQGADTEAWVEFVKGGAVAGREVASVVGAVEIAQVAKGKRPKAGASSVEMLKGGDYWRVWLNKGGTNYLINLPPAK